MPLTKSDLKQIGKLLDQRFDEQDKKFSQKFDDQNKKFSGNLDNQRDKLVKCIKAETKIVMARIDRLEERMNTLDIDNRREHREILTKIEALRNTENEDILAINKDVEKLEKRVVRLQAKTV